MSRVDYLNLLYSFLPKGNIMLSEISSKETILTITTATDNNHTDQGDVALLSALLRLFAVTVTKTVDGNTVMSF